VEHTIKIKDSNPIKQTRRRISFHFPQKEVDEIIEEIRQQGVIEESCSSWVSCSFDQKEGRFCVDFRKLNAFTKKDFYPIPRIDDMLD